MRNSLLVVGLVFALMACHRAPTDEATGAATASATPTPTIPKAMQGKWGMVPADCEKGRSDAKGLLIVGPTTLTFYESVGTLKTVEQLGDTSLDAQFAFTGEGTSWTQEEMLELEDGGRTLSRSETGAPEAGGGPFSYSRCPA